MLSALLVLTGAFWVFVAVLYVSPRCRKSTLIAVTYATLTLWYYYRKLEKKYMPLRAQRRRSMSRSRRSEASSSASHVETEMSTATLRFESTAETPVEPAPALAAATSTRLSDPAAMTERGSSSSSSSNGTSAVSEEPNRKSPRFKLGILRKLQLRHEAEAEAEAEVVRMEQRVSSPTVSESDLAWSPRGNGTPRPPRRVFVGRKKPPNWAD